MSARVAVLMDRAATRLAHALNDYRTIGLEFHLAFSAIMSGAWIIARGMGKPTILSVLPATALGILIAGHGVLYAQAILEEIRPWVPRTAPNLALCLRGAVFSTFLWATLFLAFVIGPPRISLAIPLVFANMLGSLWAATRLHLKAALDEVPVAR